MLAAGGMTFDQAMAGVLSTCGISGGTAYCWGENLYGRLGTGVGDHEAAPTPLAGGRSYEFISQEAVNNILRGGCGITTDGRLTCWGNNEHQELGTQTSEECDFNDNLGPCSTVPVLAELDEAVTHVGLGRQHTCALTDSEEVYCWGQNDQGQLGRGTVDDAGLPPAPVTGLPAN